MVDKVLIKEAKWFTPDDRQVQTAFLHTFRKYEECLRESKKQGQVSRRNWNMKSMELEMQDILDTKVPILPRQMKIKLPPISKK